MSPNSPVWLVVLAGAVIGVFVGLVGTSGAITIPALIYVFGLTQLRAQGTALFIALLPVWIGPLWPYIRAGQVEWRVGLLLGAGLAGGGYLGGVWAQTLPTLVMRRMFAAVLFALSVRMFFQR